MARELFWVKLSFASIYTIYVFFISFYSRSATLATRVGGEGELRFTLLMIHLVM